MKLIIDIGNTNTKLALFENGEMVAYKVCGAPILSVLQTFVSENPGISHCILSSTIDFDPEIRDWLINSVPYFELDETTPIPIQNLYKTPSTLGRDRIASAVGASSLFPYKDVLVINAGTCITYDFVTSKGQYLGGAISPGMLMRFKAMNTFTAKLPLIDYNEIDDPIGTSTEESLLSGVIYGISGEIEAMCQNYQERYPNVKVVLSGGDLNYFDKRLKVSIFAVPNIVIHGLYKILEFNVTKNP